MKKSMTLAALWLSACAPTVQQVKANDGTTNQLIRCDELPKCVAKANEICKKKFEVIDQSSTNDTTTGINYLVKCDADKTPPVTTPNVFMPSPTLPMPYEK